MNKLVNVREALAVAIYAFRANNNMVVRDMYHNDHVEMFPNKAYLIKHFIDSSSSLNISAFEITDELLAEADNVKQQLEYIVTMSVLIQGRTNPFTEDCAKLVSADSVGTKHFGTLVWIPKLVSDNQAKETAKIRSAQLEHSSKYIGKLSDRIELNFNLIEKRYINNINCWAAYGHTDEGNLVKFLTKYEELCNNGTIRGRIKEITRDTYRNNAQVTSLNHVKKI